MRARPPRLLPNTVFLNIPYDDRFRHLYIAYISGVVHLGLTPRATLEIPGTKNRLEKIIDLIRSCRYSIHDPLMGEGRLAGAAHSALQYAF